MNLLEGESPVERKRLKWEVSRRDSTPVDSSSALSLYAVDVSMRRQSCPSPSLRRTPQEVPVSCLVALHSRPPTRTTPVLISHLLPALAQSTHTAVLHKDPSHPATRPLDWNASEKEAAEQ